MSGETDLDLVIVGAGAAGIGAGLVARAAGLKFRILEASDRVGGRAHTISRGGVTYDLGCHYLHHASRNPFAATALSRGQEVSINLTHDALPEAYYRNGVRQDEATRQACSKYYQVSDNAYEIAEADVAGSTVIDTTSPFYDVYTGWCEAMNGVPPTRVSTHDIQRYKATAEDWPVKDGYGALIASFAEGLPVTFDCPVHAIDRTGSSVTVDCAEGTLRTKTVVVTVSPAVLKSGSIHFTPALPAAVEKALVDVPMGLAERIALFTDGLILPPGERISAHTIPKAGKMLIVKVHEFGKPIVEGYIAGDLARELTDAGGRAALIDYTETAAVEMFGSALRSKILDRVSSCWSTDPLIFGGYSAALPGRSASRAGLSERFDERLVLAGEACSPDQQTTAHGAYFSGVRAVSHLVQDGLKAD